MALKHTHNKTLKDGTTIKVCRKSLKFSIDLDMVQITICRMLGFDQESYFSQYEPEIQQEFHALKASQVERAVLDMLYTSGTGFYDTFILPDDQETADAIRMKAQQLFPQLA